MTKRQLRHSLRSRA